MKVGHSARECGQIETQAFNSQLRLSPAPPGRCPWLKQHLTSLQFPNNLKKAVVNVERRVDAFIREIKESDTKQQPSRIS